MKSHYTLKFERTSDGEMNSRKDALAGDARLLPVERPFRLVCPKYSATGHQRKMYR